MAYEGDRAGYVQMLAAATVAAGILRRPSAFALVASLGVLISNPGDMSKAAGEWRDPKLSGGADLDAIKEQLITLKGRIKNDGHWEGDAYNVFSTAVDDFAVQLDNAKRYRQGAGDTLDQTASLYHATFEVVRLIVYCMGIIAAVYIASKLYPPWGAAVELWVTGVLEKLDGIVKAIISRKLKAVGAVGILLWMLNGFQKDQERLFWGMQALPQQETDFTQVSLQYDKNGGLVQKPDTSAFNVPNMKGSSFIPGIPGL
ncbi:hypothetical protein [Streptosporangium carneum]|uniref:WXG100 family type VII secretion target n=1 Tax=Streptosporangium carneum TaxID=47481 RepID=A0A9W6MGU3_9ACTN|nr:hypothetical protein [Streptosporangium carneum]GLK13601.1 hypothetical protein GCM10017600_70120 [Streptosporangium carneum]